MHIITFLHKNLTNVPTPRLHSPAHQILHLEILSAKMSDLANEVNGFYGPGTWAAWVITLMASWIPILRKDYKSNIHYISYALYTNWAAIDLFRQKPSTRTLQPRSTEDPDDPLLLSREKVMAAPFAVVGVGIVHAYMQYIICLRQHREEEKLENGNVKAARRRSYIMLLGIALPSIAWLVWIHGMCLEVLKSPIFGLTVAMLLLTVSSNALFFTVFPVLLAMLMYNTNVCEGGTVLGRLSRRCYIIPCAPQSISEWDQAFALFLALFFFTYEFGPASVRFVWKKIKGTPSSQALSDLEVNASTAATLAL
jgi:hypothetical protein